MGNEELFKELNERLARIKSLLRDVEDRAEVVSADAPKTQFMKIAEALLLKGNRPQSTRWIMQMTGISRSALSQVIHRTHKNAFVSADIPGYSTKKLWALTKEAADEITAQLRTQHGRQATLFDDADEGNRDFASLKATDCCAIILNERGNEPMSALTLARESLARGYVGEPHGTEDEKLLRTAKSFWAAMGRDTRFEEVRPLVFNLKHPEREKPVRSDVD
jgi:hypothetical protein